MNECYDEFFYFDQVFLHKSQAFKQGVRGLKLLGNTAGQVLEGERSNGTTGTCRPVVAGFLDHLRSSCIPEDG